jgi:hypothetical protein
MESQSRPTGSWMTDPGMPPSPWKSRSVLPYPILVLSRGSRSPRPFALPTVAARQFFWDPQNQVTTPLGPSPPGRRGGRHLDGLSLHTWKSFSASLPPPHYPGYHHPHQPEMGPVWGLKLFRSLPGSYGIHLLPYGSSHFPGAPRCKPTPFCISGTVPGLLPTLPITLFQNNVSQLFMSPHLCCKPRGQ